MVWFCQSSESCQPNRKAVCASSFSQAPVSLDRVFGQGYCHPRVEPWNSECSARIRAAVNSCRAESFPKTKSKKWWNFFLKLPTIHSRQLYSPRECTLSIRVPFECVRERKMVFFINIYGRATDPPDKDKGNQICGGGGDNDIVDNRYEQNRWGWWYAPKFNCSRLPDSGDWFWRQHRIGHFTYHAINTKGTHVGDEWSKRSGMRFKIVESTCVPRL